MAGRGTRVRKRKGNLNGFEEWGGYMNAKKEKLERQFDSDQVKEVDKREGIFEGIAIFVNGYTDPSADELKRIMMLNGGTFHHYMNKKGWVQLQLWTLRVCLFCTAFRLLPFKYSIQFCQGILEIL